MDAGIIPDIPPKIIIQANMNRIFGKVRLSVTEISDKRVLLNIGSADIANKNAIREAMKQRNMDSVKNFEINPCLELPDKRRIAASFARNPACAMVRLT